MIAVACPSPAVPAPAAPGPLEGVRGRFASFHRDEDGQILPLIFFLAIAFFIGVGMIVNTGQTVDRRIESQDAIDAAAVSGATSVARGMNYLARNNVTMAKVLTSIVLIRSLEPAIKVSDGILTGWLIGAEIMIRVGQVLSGTVLLSAVGVAMEVAGGIIKFKVKIERKVLTQLLKFARKVGKFWDNPILSGAYKGAGSGWGWKVTQCMSLLGDVLAYGTPILAQLTAIAIHKENLGEDLRVGTGCFMVPLYTRLPVCQGPFSTLGVKVSGYLHDPVMKYVDIVGWPLLTLSFFPLTYRAAIKKSLREIFPSAPAADDDPPADDPDAAKLKELGDEMEQIQKDIEPLEARLKQLDEVELPAARTDLQTKQREEASARAAWVAERDNGQTGAAHRQAVKRRKDAYDAATKARKASEKALKKLEDERADVQKDIEKKTKRAAKIQEEIDEIRGKHDEDPGAGEGSDGGTFGKMEEDPLPRGIKRGIHPYVVDTRGNWQRSSTYFAIGFRRPPLPLLHWIYATPAVPVPGPSWVTGTAFTYAAARLYSPSEADLWNADWHAKLVRADMSNIQLNPFGAPPTTCAAAADASDEEPPASAPPPSAPPSGAKKPTMTMTIDIYGFQFDVGALIPHDVWDSFQPSFSIGMPSGPGAVGKH